MNLYGNREWSIGKKAQQRSLLRLPIPHFRFTA